MFFLWYQIKTLFESTTSVMSQNDAEIFQTRKIEEHGLNIPGLLIRQKKYLALSILFFQIFQITITQQNERTITKQLINIPGLLIKQKQYLALSSTLSVLAKRCPDFLQATNFPLLARNEMEPSACQTKSNRQLEDLERVECEEQIKKKKNLQLITKSFVPGQVDQ